MNELYNIFNTPYINQQSQQQHHFRQIKQVEDTAKALKDFLDGIDKIETAYQNMASVQFCSILADYINRHAK